MPNYFDIMRRFRTAHRIKPFTPVQYVFFIELLGECNFQGWPDRFQLPPRYMETSIGCSRDCLCKVRKELCRRGFIKFTPGSIHRPAVYSICFDVNPYDLPLDGEGNAAENETDTEVKAAHDKRGDSPHDNLNDKCGYITDDKENDKGDDKEADTYKEINKTKTKEKSPEGAKKKASDFDLKREDLSPAETLRLYRSNAVPGQYATFLEWLQQNVPYVASHIYPPTEQEFYTLRKYFGPQSIGENLLNLENRKDLRKRYKSVYQTLLNWCARGAG